MEGCCIKCLRTGGFDDTVVNAENVGLLYTMSNSSPLSLVEKNYRVNKPEDLKKKKFKLHLPIKKKVVPLRRCQHPTEQPPHWHAEWIAYLVLYAFETEITALLYHNHSA